MEVRKLTSSTIHSGLVLTITLLILLATTAYLAAPTIAPTDPGPVPFGAIARIGKGYPYHIRISPNEKRIAVGTTFGVYMYDAASMEQMWFRRESDISDMAFSNDSSLLVTVRPLKHDLITWNVNGGSKYRTYQTQNAPVSAAYSQDDKNIAIVLWDVYPNYYHLSVLVAQTGTELYSTSANEFGWLGGHVDAAPDNSMILTSSGDMVFLFDLPTGALLHSLGADAYLVQAVRFSPDSQYVTAGYFDGTLATWNTKSGEMLYKQAVPNGVVDSVNFSADSSQIVISNRGGVFVYDTVSGGLLRSFEQITQWSTPSSFHYYAYCSIDGSVRAWSDGAPGGFTIRDVETNEIVAASTGHLESITSAALSLDGKTLALSRDYYTSEVWDVEARQRLNTFPLTGIAKWPRTAISPDGKLVSAYSDGGIETWDTATSVPISIINLDPGWGEPFELTYVSDGSLWIWGWSPGNMVSQWDTTTGQQLQTIEDYVDTTDYVFPTFAPNGQLIAFLRQKEVHGPQAIDVWDISAHSIRFSIDPLSYVYTPAFSPDGSRLVLVRADTDDVNVWDTQTGELIRKITFALPGYYNFYALAISADNKVLAMGDESGAIVLYNLDTGIWIKTLKGHYEPIVWLGFSSANGQLISASADGTVVYWPKP